MLDLIEQLSKILNESYSEKTLSNALSSFFNKNFNTDKFIININNNEDISHLKFSYPIYKHKKCIGSLEFSNKTKKLEKFVDLCAQFISLKIQNIIISDKMNRDIEFHDIMKNIAKIIETQYELKYIIPIIGEMLDKFFENYLIYIFIKDNKNTNILSFPSACNDTKILELVKNNEHAITTENFKISALPLICEEKNLGSIIAKSTSEQINSKDIEYLTQLCTQISITINRANVYSEILKHATLDALTGFYNRRQLEERIKQEVANAKRQHAPLCGIMTDIDFFKSVNDTYGHAVGDLVLKNIAKVIRKQLREYDIAGRYGGEEFSILLPFTKIDEAKMVAERLRQAIENKVIDISKIVPDSDVKTLKITVSLGIYEIKETDKEEDLLRKADKALYEAKNTGRNKVVVYYD